MSPNFFLHTALQPKERMAASTPSFLPQRLTAQGVIVLLLYIGIESIAVLTVTAASQGGGGLPFNSSSVVLVVECVKLVVSVLGLWSSPPAVLPGAPEPPRSEQWGGLVELRRVTLASFAKYGIPSLIYAVNNNLFLFIMTQLSASSFQLLLNSRVVWTGFAFRWLLNRHLTRTQWIASCVLLFGCALSQLPSSGHGGSSGGGSAGGSPESLPPSVSLYGFGLAMVYCSLSVSASVYNELLMKTEPSLHLSNIQLYTFGIAVNLVGLLYQVGCMGGVRALHACVLHL
jgi:drug/metabolite transporter (DMT)-like permease